MYSVSRPYTTTECPLSLSHTVNVDDEQHLYILRSLRWLHRIKPSAHMHPRAYRAIRISAAAAAVLWPLG